MLIGVALLPRNLSSHLLFYILLRVLQGKKLRFRFRNTDGTTGTVLFLTVLLFGP
jgi:hypothetical protein